MFIIFSGVSASGKNTVMQELVKRDKHIKVLTNSSGTTRPPRPSDKDNSTYIFMSHNEFEEGIERGEFFEYEQVHGNYYGILNSALDRVIDNQDIDFVRDIDVHGREKIVEYFKGRCQVVTIFLDAPNRELIRRLKERGEEEDKISIRLSRSELERGYKKDYDLVVENIDLEKTLETILNFIKESRNSTKNAK